MTIAEARMTKEARMTNAEKGKAALSDSSFGSRHSFVIRASSFVISPRRAAKLRGK